MKRKRYANCWACGKLILLTKSGMYRKHKKAGYGERAKVYHCGGSGGRP